MSGEAALVFAVLLAPAAFPLMPAMTSPAAEMEAEAAVDPALFPLPPILPADPATVAENPELMALLTALTASQPALQAAQSEAAEPSSDTVVPALGGPWSVSKPAAAPVIPVGDAGISASVDPAGQLVAATDPLLVSPSPLVSPDFPPSVSQAPEPWP